MKTFVHCEVDSRDIESILFDCNKTFTFNKISIYYERNNTWKDTSKDLNLQQILFSKLIYDWPNKLMWWFLLMSLEKSEEYTVASTIILL